ncbi:hypothetical protein MHZ92_14535 [Sporosarcina sp. ACRSL]|uniref:hypothetical protein n=1 Tax=Sporosarcina sp. ACRSL TaxID=2918215 RepID=UPI001EF5CAAD|nr:hypothetical protein [Sporosarcina sp. ACRSL]MCG7345353.1 hypothetical protein [Sporosarcina sp. ACRSL]
MFMYELPIVKDSFTQHKRNLNEAKLTYAQYNGDIPEDDDPADYNIPLKGVRLA